MHTFLLAISAWFVVYTFILNRRSTWRLFSDCLKPVQVEKPLLRLKTDDAYASALRLRFDRRIIGR